jgi:hypothetical protein
LPWAIVVWTETLILALVWVLAPISVLAPIWTLQLVLIQGLHCAWSWSNPTQQVLKISIG